ncbi:MAG: hypothetical protein K2L55_07775 [Muribaculaceae bacterium]|nr:hypothetical protein [Muribaculaceae bacterium]
MKISAILPAVVILSAGCRSNPLAAADDNAVNPPEIVRNDDVVRDGAPPAFLPRAVIYRTNGDYDDRVTVTLDASGTSLLSYPAPTDVTAASAPLVVADNWLLDRRGGISMNTAFLDWTYAQYASMKRTPTPAEIMSHIIPDARVIAVKTLPLTATEAATDTARVNAIITHLSDTKVSQVQSRQAVTELK